MKTMEQLKARHDEELKEAELEQGILDAIAAEFPSLSLDGVLICIHRTNGLHASVRLWKEFCTEKKLADAMPVVNHFAEKDALVDGEHWKDGPVSDWPAEINSHINHEHAVMDGSHAVEIAVSGGRHYGPSVEIKFWTRLAGVLCEISLPVCDLWQLVPRVDVSYNNHGDLSRCEIRWPVWRNTCNKFVSFWSEKPSFNGSYYSADIHNFRSFVGSLGSKFSILVRR